LIDAFGFDAALKVLATITLFGAVALIVTRRRVLFSRKTSLSSDGP
jgi:hypothetical protein